jgi:hypothetical protein
MSFLIMRFHPGGWGDPCPTCVEADIRAECRRPLITDEAINPLSRYRKGAICHDCAAAENLMSIGITFEMARTSVANDRQEAMRMPGRMMPTRIMAAVGELEAIHEWMKGQEDNDGA